MATSSSLGKEVRKKEILTLTLRFSAPEAVRNAEVATLVVRRKCFSTQITDPFLGSDSKLEPSLNVLILPFLGTLPTMWLTNRHN